MLPFYLLLTLSQVVGIMILILVGYWTGHTLGGYAWDGSGREFNLHPLFMTIGLVFLYGDGILIFRVFRHNSSSKIKIVHLLFHSLALIFACVGLKTVFNFHRVQSFPDMYSLHSWVGLSAFILFVLQWMTGIACFLYPRLRDELRVTYLPLHRYIGVATFAMVIAAACAGINEKLFFVYSGRGDSLKYSALPHGAYIGNFLGFLILLFGLIVGYLVSNSDFRRQTSNPARDGLEEGTLMNTTDQKVN
eukprot:XP_003728314.2 PREDICTED: cytochrome b561-like isoform X2 [Strongylocentrotus purpuratus]